MNTKNEQDLHLQRMIELTDVKKHRARQQDAKLKDNTFKYHVLLQGIKVLVCREAFFRLYDVSDKRIRRIRKLLLAGKTPVDLRGKNTSGNKIQASETDKVHKHISSFPTKEGHYKDVLYLSENLSIRKMHELFCEMHPESNIKYNFYYTYFKENFNFRFGRPPSDTCNTCEEKMKRIRDPRLNENAKKVCAAEFMLHKRRAKRFYSSMANSKEVSKQNNNTLGLVFDFMQNIDLPKVPVQEMYYLRQLTVNNFCIYNLKTDNAQFYLYHEGQAKKGANDVASFLVDYIEENVPHSVTELHLFSDNCPGQNKNHTLIRVLLTLTIIGRFKKIKHFFPLTGHSFLPCDRKFGIIKRPIRNCSRIYTIYQLCELILSVNRKSQNTIKLIDTENIIDFDNWWPNVFKKRVASTESVTLSWREREYLATSKYHYFEYSSDKKGNIKTSEFIHTDNADNDSAYYYCNFNVSKVDPSIIQLPQALAYTNSEMIPLKKEKIEDLKKALKYVPHEHEPFYQKIINFSEQNQ